MKHMAYGTVTATLGFHQHSPTKQGASKKNTRFVCSRMKMGYKWVKMMNTLTEIAFFMFKPMNFVHQVGTQI